MQSYKILLRLRLFKAILLRHIWILTAKTDRGVAARVDEGMPSNGDGEP